MRIGDGQQRRMGVVFLLGLLSGPLALAQVPSQPGARAARPPAIAFAREPAVHSVTMSPSGERMALLIGTPNGRRALAMMDTAKPENSRVLAAFNDADVLQVWWVNDKRLVYSAAEVGEDRMVAGRGIFAVDHDGGGLRQIGAWERQPAARTDTKVAMRMLSYEWEVHSMLQDGSDDIVMRFWPRSAAGEVSDAGHLARVDTHTVVTRNLSADVPAPASVTLLDSKGQVRVVQSFRDGRARLLWKPPGGDDWVVLDDRELFDERALNPVALESDDELIVETRRNGDTAALHTYRLKDRRLDPEAIVALEGYDVGGGLERAGPLGAVLGVHTLADRPVTVWFEPHLAASQAAIDKALPAGRSNVIVCGHCKPGTPLAVYSGSDTEPGEWFLFDPKQRALKRFGSTRPALAGVPQGTRSAHRVAARDGLPLPVWVTHPAGSRRDEPLPTVVLLHGGPWVRGGSLLWDAEAQFFASRGWRVVEPEFRGSTGFGWKHFSAGFKQWGLAMQDDVADAVQWAVKEKLADPKRVCVYGASYGGYAALMGPIRHPELYRCAASHVGVTDIELMYTATWGDLTLESRRYSMPKLVGDPKADAEQLRRTSPLQRVAEIKVPVLLGQGTLDRRVPPEHADKFERAAKAAGVKIERVDFYKSGHGFSTPEEYAEWMDRLEAFFGKAFAQPQ
jgi:dipeptidyl aminopeptidase/acylaminoacyl peptidase